MLSISHLCHHLAPYVGTLFSLWMLWTPILSQCPDSERMAPHTDQAATPLTWLAPTVPWLSFWHCLDAKSLCWAIPLGDNLFRLLGSDTWPPAPRVNPLPTPLGLRWPLSNLPIFVDSLSPWPGSDYPTGCSLWESLLHFAWTLTSYSRQSPHGDTLLTALSCDTSPSGLLYVTSHCPPQLPLLLCSAWKL